VEKYLEVAKTLRVEIDRMGRDFVSFIRVRAEDYEAVFCYGLNVYRWEPGPTTQVVRFMLPDDIGIRAPSPFISTMLMTDLGLDQVRAEYRQSIREQR
jgi:hypothetical protein